MKKATTLFLALTLLLGSIGTAQADWNRHRGHYYRDDFRHERHHGHHRHHRGSWAGPAAILAITGLAIGAAAYSRPAPVYSAPVYAPPPPPVPIQIVPEPASWYYCGSSGQYYPYVRSCPEGWQPVMPDR